MKLTYTNVNGYLIPNLTYKSGEQMEQLGKYGFLRRDYLKNHRNSTYQVMLLQDTIGEHLLEVDKAAREREEVILEQLEEKEPLPDKEKDQMAWVRAANQHRAIAEACVLLTQKRNEKDYEFEIEVSLMIDSDRLFEDSRPTYTNIRKYVFDKYGIKLQLKDIADVKRDYGMKMKVNKHLIKGDEPVRRKCTPNKRKYIIEALKYYHVI